MLISVIVGCLSVSLVASHRSLPPGVTCGNQFSTSSTALEVPNPRISWAAYRILTCDAPLFWVAAPNVDVGQNLFFTVTVPVIERFAPARVHVLVIGPGLPRLSAEDEALLHPDAVAAIGANEGAVLYTSPEDQSSCAHVHSDEMSGGSDVMNSRCHFHEPYGDTHSWVLLDDHIVALASGTHRFAVSSTDGSPLKLSFACCDWPEDFTTPYSLPAADCPFCGTKASFPQYSSHFYETKSMSGFGGFPAVGECDGEAALPSQPDPATQCPNEAAVGDANAGGEQSESCALHCTREECHSHNIRGECSYVMRWITPKPMLTVGDRGINVTSLILFKGDTVLFTSANHFWPHDLVRMESKAHLDTCNFAGMSQILTVEELRAGAAVTFNTAGVFYYSCAMTGHCGLGQKLMVTVRDATEGMECHKHSIDEEEDLEHEEEEAECAQGLVRARAIEDANYGAGPGQCSEFCTATAGLSMMNGVQPGGCESAGYVVKVMETIAQPQGSAQTIDVVILRRRMDAECHCHSKEEISCDGSGEALYAEHIAEIEEYCQGVVSGADTKCAYNCFQPFEVLHLHYMECSLRSKHPYYEQIEERKICHMAIEPPAEAQCEDGAMDIPVAAEIGSASRLCAASTVLLCLVAALVP